MLPGGHNLAGGVNMNEWTAQLLEQARRGDQRALAALYDEHAPAVASYFLRCGFKASDAQDLTQDVFVRAFRSLHTFDPARSGLRTWLGAIARNVARRAWHKTPPGGQYDAELAAETLAEPPNPGQTPEAREEMDALGDCISHLPSELGRLVELRYVKALTGRAIAAELRMAESTVRLRLEEAKAALARCLRSKGFAE